MTYTYRVFLIIITMKHHIFHKSYRHFHILSFIIAVIIAGTWIHLSTQTAKSDIKLGYIRNFTTTNSDDLGDVKNDSKPKAGGVSTGGGSSETGNAGSSGAGGDTSGGGVIKQMATNLVSYVKQLIGLSSPDTSNTAATDTTVADAVVPDPCLALTDANRVSILNQAGSVVNTTKSAEQASATMNTTSRKSVAVNPCTKLPVELLPCAVNYSAINEAASAATPTKADALVNEKAVASRNAAASQTKVSCNFIKADTAKESLKRTLLNNIQTNYLPTTDLKPGDSGAAVLQLQKLMNALGDKKVDVKNLSGVYDEATVKGVMDLQKTLSEKFPVTQNGILDSATRIAFLNFLSLQIDEFLSSFKDYTYDTGITTSETSNILTKISLDKIPVIKKETTAPATTTETTDVVYSDTDPCLALTPIDATKGAGPNPCHYIPLSILPCAINYVVNEKGDVVYDSTKGGTACKFIKGKTLQESLQKTAVSNAAAAIANLKVGDKSRSVSALESLLNVVLYVQPSNYKIEVDGNYSAALTDFIKEFQKSVGLTSDGVLGKNTQEKLIDSFNTAFTLFMNGYVAKNSTTLPAAVYAGDPCQVLQRMDVVSTSVSSVTAAAAAPAPASATEAEAAKAAAAAGAPAATPAAKSTKASNPCANAPQVLIPCAAEYTDPTNYPKKSSCVFPAATNAQESLKALIMNNVVSLLPGKEVSLVLGTTGDGVKSLQVLLNAMFGTPGKPVVVENGVYDATMVSYVADMQKGLGLSNDGVFGPGTREALYNKINTIIGTYLSYFQDVSLKTK